MLIYTRILYPGSKRSSLEDAKKFFEQPECSLEQVYRALSLLADEFNEIQADVYKRDLTNHLHGSAGFRTDTQIITRQKMRSIIAQTKKREKDEDDDK